MFGSLWGLRGEKRGDGSNAVAHTEPWSRTMPVAEDRVFFFFLPVLGAAVPLGAGSHIKRR